MNHEPSEKAPKLPFRIDRIKKQLQHPNRVNLYENDIFIMGISTDVLVAQGLSEGDIVTKELYTKLVQDEDYGKIKNVLLRYLSRRAHSRSELLRKSKLKGYNGAIVEKILDELAERDWINDHNFASAYTLSKIQKKWGPQKIKAGLYQAGVSTEIITTVLAKEFAEQDIAELMQLALTRKRHALLREKDPQKRQQKLYLFLQSKGFHSSDIQKNSTELLNSL